MNHEQILEKAIQQAIEGGWRKNIDHSLWECKVFEHPRIGLMIGWRPNQLITYISDDVPYTHIIFNHDFAKALWGEGWHFTVGNDSKGRFQTVCTKCGGLCSWWAEEPSDYDSAWIKCWQYHLQQMVIADDPIKYLGEHLND